MSAADRTKWLLLAASLGVLALLVVAALRENVWLEWRQVQAQVTLDGAPAPVRLRQVVNPALGVADRCVSCHVSDATHYVPGLFVGSVFPSVNGTTMYGPAYTTDHRSPFELRWGGWYVTGKRVPTIARKTSRSRRRQRSSTASPSVIGIVPTSSRASFSTGRLRMTFGSASYGSQPWTRR